MYSQHLGFVYCGILLVLAVFQDYVLRILPYCHTRSIFWVRYSGILLYFKYFGVPYSGILVVVQHYPLSHSVSTYWVAQWVELYNHPNICLRVRGISSTLKQGSPGPFPRQTLLVSRSTLITIHDVSSAHARKKTSYEVDDNRTRDPSFGGHTALPIRTLSQLVDENRTCDPSFGGHTALPTRPLSKQALTDLLTEWSSG